MARKFICSELLNTDKSYIEVQSGDALALDIKNNTLVGEIKQRYIAHKTVSIDIFTLKQLGSTTVIGPFQNNVAEKVIRRINGFVSRANKDR